MSAPRNELLRIGQTLAVDSRLTVSSIKEAQIRRGAANYTIQRQTASTLSNGQIIWNVVLSNPARTIIDSYMYGEYAVTVTVSASGLTGTTVQAYVNDNFAPRQYPIASVTQVSNVQINNQSVSMQPYQVIHPLSWAQFYQNQALVQSLVPIMPDQAPVYNLLTGSQKNPLNTYVDGGQHYSEPRGSFLSLFQTVSNSASAWVFNWTIREPIINSMLCYDPSDNSREGLAYVNLLNITLNFTSNLSRMFSLDAIECPLITGITVNINSANLVMNWLTAPVSMQLPPRVLRSFDTIIANQTNSNQAVAPGAQVTLQSQTFSFNQIPRKIWIYVGDQNLDTPTGFTKSDFWFSIQSISVLFNNRSSLLANLSTGDLYNNFQSAEGSKMSFVQSQEWVGAVLELDPALHFGLLDTESPSVMGIFNFQIQVVTTNISPTATITPNIWVTVANDTVLDTSAESVSTLIQGWIRPEDVVATNGLPPVSSDFSESTIWGGNSVFDKIGDFFKSSKLISSGLGAILPFPFGPLAKFGLEKLGVGRNPRRRGGARTNRAQMMRAYDSLYQ